MTSSTIRLHNWQHLLHQTLACIAFLTCPFNVSAQEARHAAEVVKDGAQFMDAEDDAITMDEITVTATRQSHRRFDVPQDVTVIDQQEITRRTPNVLPDYLRGREGVYVQQTTPGQASPIVRGLMGSEILVLVDGMRLNNAFFRPAPNQYLALVDPNIVQRLEVVRGPGSTLYGSDALGGVINVLTHTPRFDSNQWQMHGRSLAQYGSADTSGMGRLSMEGGKRGVGIAAGLTYSNVGDLRGGGGIGVQRPSGYTSYAADAALSVEGDSHDLLLTVQYLRQPKTPRYDELVAGFGQTHPSSALFFFEPNDRLFLHGRYRLYRPFPIVDRLEVNMAYQQINDDRRQQEFGSTDEIRERNRSSLTGITVQLTSESRWMTFTYGAEVYLDRIASSSIARDLSTGTTFWQQSRFADGSTMNSYAVYGQSEIRLHPRLTAVLGGRLNYFTVTIPPADRGIGADLQIMVPTGNLGLIYHLTQEVNLVTNVGRGFRVPNVFDLSTLGPRPGNRFNLPNPSLAPEQVISVDAGVKVAASRFAGEAFGFYSFLPDKISAQPTGTVTSEGRQIVQSMNSERVTIWGIEVGSSFRVAREWDIVGSVTYTFGNETLANGRSTPAERIPPLNGRIGAYYHPTPHVWFQPFLRFASSQDRMNERDLIDPRINPNGTRGWVSINLLSGWQITENYLARLAIENFLNQPYREHGSGINAPGINVIASIEARF
jgi:hemoglobin/transferrin/lactoferrin receptor protein